KPRSTLWKSSIHAGSAHITCRKTVRMCSTWLRFTSASSPTCSLTLGRWGCGERSRHSLGLQGFGIWFGGVGADRRRRAKEHQTPVQKRERVKTALLNKSDFG
ncbi:TPA: hypothetical protein ACIYGJ_005590, partial [Escherichia coli]